MKRLWIAVAILLAMLGGTLGNSWYLNGLICNWTEQLTAAHQLAAGDDWTQASQITQQVISKWQDYDFYLHVMLPHRDIDDIHLTFCEVQEYLELEESDQYNSANAKLIAQLGLLGEMEQLNLKNIL